MIGRKIEIHPIFKKLFGKTYQPFVKSTKQSARYLIIFTANS
ncbi:hypothetical protein C943_03413 [Mariniradius saccharolyticus AK6]|uniref:Uncharacterized protein n=1 Tax=Mariniradius saccharolyticus AK6 TaxID=1239962 RepID=M7YC26_9BACT|nr:hypothetical protein C943_03413 [Mariniradius saccharolyticus AK6]